ncbi:hypothetical protein GTP58_00615 [Duganella sp. CY15W]|uniref:hypothetical protein n=1 Tax=Duganella sp. CY15W TaxID=2692172 RepID=UPI00136D8BF2|nr:hypothetical protein [Duganella sp. CY15W]MYM26820.1 hypothetical protein [Duganella sp. CY15W]
MKITSGKIVAGQIVVEDMPFDDGTAVTIFSRDETEAFDLTPEQEAELLQALEEAERGDTVTAPDLLRSLRPSV